MADNSIKHRINAANLPNMGDTDLRQLFNAVLADLNNVQADLANVQVVLNNVGSAVANIKTNCSNATVNINAATLSFVNSNQQVLKS